MFAINVTICSISAAVGRKSIVTLICLVTICSISAAVRPKSVVTLICMVNICEICAALRQNSKAKMEVGVTTQYIAAVVLFACDLRFQVPVMLSRSLAALTFCLLTTFLHTLRATFLQPFI